jgi:hypothetical protein
MEIIIKNKNRGDDMTGPAFGDSFKKAQSADNPVSFTIERVTDPAILERDWEPLLVEIFPDENDREPIETLREAQARGESFFLMRDADGKPVGIELAQPLPGQGAMYIPWTGVLPEYRNLGIGSEMNRYIAGFMREKFGVTHTLLDIEDPARLHNSAYDPDELPEAIGMATRRINFWRRENFLIVDDPSARTGEKLEYCRPASNDEQDIQAYDHMAIRLEGGDKSPLRPFLSADGMRVAKSFVRDCYLQMTRIQYGDRSEDDLRAAYPAVDKYLSDLDASPDEWLATHTSEVAPKRTPKVPVSLRLIDEGEAARLEAQRQAGIVPFRRPAAGAPVAP